MSFTKLFTQNQKRVGLLFSFLVSFGSLLFAFFLQIHYQLVPCPLCLFSRFILMLLALLFFSWFIHSYFTPTQLKRGVTLFYFSLSTLGIACGVALSLYHSWLIHLPPERLPSCGPDLSYLLNTLPLHEAIIIAFKGSSSCAQDPWRLMGLSLPQLELGVYLLLAVLHSYSWRQWGKTRGV